MDATALILDWLAVSEDALTPTHLATLVHRYTETKRRPTLDAIYELVQSIPDVDVDKRVFLHRAVAETRVRSLLDAGQYVGRARQVAEVEPLQEKTNHWGRRFSYNARAGTFARELRLALVTGDDARIRQMPAKAWGSLWLWFADPLDTARLRVLPQPWANLVLDTLITSSHAQVRGIPGLIDVARDLLRDAPNEGLARIVAAERLLAGRPCGDLTEMLPNTEEAGLQRLIAGDPKGAAKHFADALRSRRDRHGKDALPQTACGAFTALAFFASGLKTRRKQALRLCALTGGGHRSRSVLAGWQDLAALEEGHPIPDHPPGHPIAALHHALAVRWADRPLDTEALGEAADAAAACGWDWLATELRAVVDGRETALTGLRAQQPLWERQLDGILAELGGAAKSDVPRKRVAWFLWRHSDDAQIHLDAREQTRKGSSWSKGRVIGMSRLTGLTGKQPVLTAADQAVVGGVRSSTHRSYSGYPETTWSWSPGPTWRALVGHPAVFDEATGERLTVVERPPRLEVSRDDGQVVVRMHPSGGGDVQVTRVGATGFEVTVLTAKHRRVRQLFGAGLVLPRGQKKAVARLMEAAGGLFDTGGAELEEPGSSAVVVTLVPAGTGLQARAVVRPLGADGPMLVPGEGADVVLGHRDGRAVRARRDLEAECDARHPFEIGLQRFAAWEEASWIADDPAAALELLAALRDLDAELLWPEGETLKLVRAARPFSMSVHTLEEWFQVDASLTLDDGRVLALRALLDAVKQSPGRFVKLDDGAFLELSHRLRSQLDRIGRVARTRKGNVQVHALASDDVAELAESVDGAVDEGFRAHRARLSSLPSVAPLPGGLQASLRPYQAEAFQWLARLAAIPAGALLADDMGLGKTVTALTLLLHRRATGPALVIAPTSLEGNWVREAERFTEGLRVRRLREHDRASLLAGLGAGDVLIASYGLLISEVDALAEVRWGTVVLDESQALKNRATRRHKAARRLQAQMRIALTGTPVENHLGELHAQLAILVPGLLPDERAFRSAFQRPIEQGDAAVARQLRQLVRPFLLRRTKGEVLVDLPPRTDVELLVELGPEQAALYEALRQRALDELGGDDVSPMQVLASLTRLRQAACAPRLVDPALALESAKLTAFGHLLDRLREGGHRALVFSQFVRHLALVRAWLDARGVAYRYLDGSTPSAQRDLEVDAFQRGEAELFLISLRAGGSGLNLTAADYVIHLDPWWNPAVEDQASDRAHRIGQTRPVTVYRLIARGTVEEQILALHRSKRELADGILEGSDAAGRLSADELLTLVRSGADR